MKFYLGSCDLGSNQQELKKWINKNGNNIILIPNALDTMQSESERQWTIRYDKEMLEEVGFEVKVVSLEDYFENYDKLENDFDKCRSFYVIGGNVFALRKAMELSGFDKYLKQKSSRDDILYGGYSAGICVLAKNLGILKLADEPVNPYNNEDILEEGIGLLDFLPIPHYKSGYPTGYVINNIVSYCNRHGIKYRTLEDVDSFTVDNMELER